MSLAFRRPSPAPVESGPAVFLHTSWRTAGTWIWNQYRANPAAMGFYEPLHEELAGLTLDGIGNTNTGSWESGHPDTPPYFLEFASLIRRSRRGVTGFDRKFAYEGFFMRPDDSNERLREYLTRLYTIAFASGRRPVFKFCRSLGRAGWMRRTWPKATHVGVIRDPIVQWESCYRLAQVDRPYFLAMPAALLAANRDETIVKAVGEILHVRLGYLRSHDFRVTFKRAEALIRDASPLTTYEVLLAFWLTTAIAGMPHMDVVIDSDRLTGSEAYRNITKDDLQQRTGIEIDFADPREPRRESTHLAGKAVERLHERAAEAAKAFAAVPIVTEKLSTSLDRYFAATDARSVLAE